MSQVIVKTYYSAAELAAMALPGMPKTKVGVIAFTERARWPAIEVKGRGGIRREYAPPDHIMVAIKETIVQRLIQGGNHESKAVPIEGGNRQNARQPAEKGGHGPDGHGAVPHAEGGAVGAPSLQGIHRDVVLLPGADQPSQPAQHGVALASAGRVHRPIESVKTHVGAAGVPAAALKDWQKRTAEARAALLQETERIASVVGREKAVMKMVIMAQDGTLPEHLARLVPVANARTGQDGSRTLSRRTMYRWFASYTPGVAAINALATKDNHAVVRIPEWASDLLSAYQQPQKPSLLWAVEQVAAKHGIDEERLYHRARRFIKKLGNVEIQAGRMGPREQKNIKPFIRRDSSMLWPAEVYSADGHTFDAEIAHPAHGKPFRPEITSVRDVNTRKLVGWSVDLAESGLAVLDALRHACETGGICSLFYVDHGSGFDNALQSAPGIGMESRLSYTKTHSLPYNSQARGVVEKGHKDIWVRAAKELPTYMGADMDAEAKNKVFKLTRKDIKTTGASKYLMPWPQFVTFVREHAERYNNRPHRSLPKVFDPTLGKKRHMTPNEAWDKGVQEGAQLVMISAEESRELFRPMKEAKVLRGEVRLFSNVYFSADLKEYHGDIVRVAYDIHNAETVWVYDQKGRYICSAGFEANKRNYFPESALELANRKRIEGQLRRIDAKRETILEAQQDASLKDIRPALENDASPILELVGGFQEVEAVAVNQGLSEGTAPDHAEAERPIFMLESDRYEWLMQHRDAWVDVDRQFLTQFVDSDIYDALRERFDALGLSWDGFEGNVFKVAV